jgi:hypothetical protein
MEDQTYIGEYENRKITCLDIYKSFKFLTRLELICCNVKIVDIDLPNLFRLKLIRNKVHTILNIPQSLIVLNLSENNVTKNYADLSNLSTLFLESNNVIDCSLLSSLSDKCSLSLKCNKIKFIKLLPTIKMLNLTNSNVRSLNRINVTEYINIERTKIKQSKPINFYVDPLKAKIKDYSYMRPRGKNKFLINLVYGSVKIY